MAKSARDFFNRVANREKSISRPHTLVAWRYSQVRASGGCDTADGHAAAPRGLMLRPRPADAAAPVRPT